MAKITIKQPDGPYNAIIDTGVMVIEIKEAFNGVLFKTTSGEILTVSMRDNGFEIHYFADNGTHGFDAGWLDLKSGVINTQKKR